MGDTYKDIQVVKEYIAMTYEKIQNKIAYLYMKYIITKRPLDINIETITMCPLKCIFCCNRIYKRDYTIMNNKHFEKLIQEYIEIGGGCIGIGSMQSDFLLDPLLMDRMKTIKKYKKKLWVHSTTPLISCKKYSDKELTQILKCFDYLVVSTLGYDKQSYQDMAGINGFDLFKEQLERVKRLIEENNLNVKVDIAFRTNNKNDLRRSAFYKEVKDTFPIGDIKDKFFSWFGSIKKEDLPRGAKLIRKNNCKIRENCVVPNATLAIQANGKVVGCGCIDWLEKYVIGDTNQNSLQEIWNSSKAKKFRNAFQMGKIPVSSFNKCMERKELLGYRSIDGLYYYVAKENSTNNKRNKVYN